MDILVLGGTYFIGRALVELLISAGHSVWILNRGTKEFPNGANPLIADRHVSNGMKSVLSGKKFDAVIDVSGYTEADIAIAIDALSGQFDQYVFCSSIAVCKQPPIYWPITELHQKCVSVQENEYGYNKWMAEQRLVACAEKYKKSVTIVRPVYVYGPNDYSGRLNYFFERISEDIQIVIAGNGENIIQFGYVYDLCKAIISIIGNKIAFGEAFNISGSELVSVNQLVSLISMVVGRKAKISHVPTGENASPLTTNHRFADVGKARDILKIFPETSLFDGLTKTYQWWLTERS